MATNKHFVIEVKPTITASKQASMADGDVLFDWTALTIPRGSAKLTNLTVMLRGNDGSPQTARDINFYFAKSIDGVAPGSLGTLSATANGIGYYNHLIAKVHLEASGDYASGLDYMSVASTGHGAANNQGNLEIVLEGEQSPTTPAATGFDKIFIAAVAGGALDFSTGSLINMGSGQAAVAAETILTTDGTHATKVFAVGDVLHAQDDAVAGTVVRIPSTTSVTVDAVAGALADDDELFVLSPITIRLSFER